MKRLLGAYIDVKLKSGEVIRGTLFDVEDDSVYVQYDVSYVATIPRENISHYISESSQMSASDVGREDDKVLERPYQPSINVFVDDEYIANVPAKNIDLTVFNEDIMTEVLANIDVSDSLGSRLLVGAEYDAKECTMLLKTAPEKPIPPPNTFRNTTGARETQQNSFSMTGNSPTENYISPSEMAARLNNFAKKSR